MNWIFDFHVIFSAIAQEYCCLLSFSTVFLLLLWFAIQFFWCPKFTGKKLFHFISFSFPLFFKQISCLISIQADYNLSLNNSFSDYIFCKCTCVWRKRMSRWWNYTMVCRDVKSDNTEMSDLIPSTKMPTASLLVFSGKLFESHNKRSGEVQNILLTCKSQTDISTGGDRLTPLLVSS